MEAGVSDRQSRTKISLVISFVIVRSPSRWHQANMPLIKPTQFLFKAVIDLVVVITSGSNGIGDVPQLLLFTVCKGLGWSVGTLVSPILR